MDKSTDLIRFEFAEIADLMLNKCFCASNRLPFHLLRVFLFITFLFPLFPFNKKICAVLV